MDDEIDCSKKLRIWVMQAGITNRDVVQFGPNSVYDTKTAKKALQMLEGHGWLVAMPKGAIVLSSGWPQSWHVVG